MKRWGRFFAIAAVCICVLSACEKSLDRQQADIEKFSAKHRYGSSSDMWLARYGMAGKERVALIYGMSSDVEFCMEIAQLYNDKYPEGARYTCEPAN